MKNIRKFLYWEVLPRVSYPFAFTRFLMQSLLRSLGIIEPGEDKED